MFLIPELDLNDLNHLNQSKWSCTPEISSHLALFGMLSKNLQTVSRKTSKEKCSWFLILICMISLKEYIGYSNFVWVLRAHAGTIIEKIVDSNPTWHKDDSFIDKDCASLLRQYINAFCCFWSKWSAWAAPRRCRQNVVASTNCIFGPSGMRALHRTTCRLFLVRAECVCCP